MTLAAERGIHFAFLQARSSHMVTYKASTHLTTSSRAIKLAARDDIMIDDDVKQSLIGSK
jgi:hypothetical protein